ncbi:uncharacterized protein METZ01_LOCUS366148 [marine metagenome]|uniref:Toxin-antitoxin system YwqK family antitoxin n=1 Tax=marine metagenome TaxID=408172 RepID=A0A382STQ6_9ZZZZ
MKKLLTILCLVLLVSCSNEPPPEVFFYELDERQGIKYEVNSNTPFTGSSVDYYENGLRVENGKVQVNYTGLRYRYNYKDGKQDGLSEDFHENGQLDRRDNYKDGKQDGLSEDFRENGQLYSRKNYKDGKEEGLTEEFWENGQLQFRINFKNGKEDGLWEYFDENGTQTSCYKNDEEVDMSYCED